LKAGPKQSRGRGKASSSSSDNNDSRRSHFKISSFVTQLSEAVAINKF
jgi:hypothetical protein